MSNNPTITPKSSFCRVAIQNAITSAESIGGRLAFDPDIAKHVIAGLRPEDAPLFRALEINGAIVIRHNAHNENQP